MAGSVWITLGSGALAGINENGQLCIRKEVRGEVVSEIEIGPATERHLDVVMLHIGSLRIHTERN